MLSGVWRRLGRGRWRSSRQRSWFWRTGRLTLNVCFLPPLSFIRPAVLTALVSADFVDPADNMRSTKEWAGSEIFTVELEFPAKGATEKYVLACFTLSTRAEPSLHLQICSPRTSNRRRVQPHRGRHAGSSILAFTSSFPPAYLLPPVDNSRHPRLLPDSRASSTPLRPPHRQRLLLRLPLQQIFFLLPR